MKGCGKITYSHGIPMPKCGEYPKGKNFIYLCEECCNKLDAVYTVDAKRGKDE